MKKFIHYKIVRLFGSLIVLCCLCGVVLPQEKAPTAVEKREAQKAWDALIRAKGGRDKLESISNILVEFEDVTRLEIFPNIKWEFGYRLDGKTRRSQLVDYSKNVQIYADDGGVTEIGHRPSRRENIAFSYMPFLLETKWDKPQLLRVRQIKQGKEKFDVIETVIENRRVDFVYEPEEMLVLEVRFYNANLVWRESYSLSNYTDIKGIKMPQTWGLKMGDDVEREKFYYQSIKFTFNVDYDPELLTRPLKATTADAWKRKP